MKTEMTVAIPAVPSAPVKVEHIRSASQLERLCSFKGESFEKLPEMTESEAIALGSTLFLRAEEDHARGIFVLADKARSLTGDKEKEFRSALRSHLELDAKTK